MARNNFNFANMHMSTFRFFSTKNANNPDEIQFDEGEQAAMADAKRVMKDFDEAVTELKSYNDWTPMIMKSKVPVILDCYAEWCNPCQKLTPILEQKAIEAEGKFKLVKINIDILPEIANGLKVRTIPAVFLVSNGNVMDTFVGVPDEERINDFINTAKLLDAISHDEKTIDQVIYAGEEHIKNEDYVTAIDVFNQSLKTANFTEEQNSRIMINMALCHAKLGEELVAKEYYIKWHQNHKNDTHAPEVQQTLDEYNSTIEELKSQEGEDEVLNELESKLEQNPESCELMFEIANHLYDKEKYEDAIDYCLDILAIDRNWNNSAPHKLLLDIFNKLGANNEIVKQSRRKLTRILF